MPIVHRRKLFWQPKSAHDPVAVSEDASTTAWVNAVVADGGAVSATQRGRVNTLITALKGHSVWTKLDRLWLYAGESDTHQAKIDLVNLATHSINSAPTLAAAGYTGDAVDDFINTGFSPAAGGDNWVQDSAAWGLYVMASRTTDQAWFTLGSAGGTSQSRTYPKFVGIIQYYVNSNSFRNVTNSDAQGLWVASRTGSATQALYHNGTSFDTDTSSSAAPDNFNFYVLARNSSGTADSHSGDQVGSVFFGSGLNATEAGNISTDVNAYMTAWGVNAY